MSTPIIYLSYELATIVAGALKDAKTGPVQLTLTTADGMDVDLVILDSPDENASDFFTE